MITDRSPSVLVCQDCYSELATEGAAVDREVQVRASHRALGKSPRRHPFNVECTNECPTLNGINVGGPANKRWFAGMLSESDLAAMAQSI
jgi:hypothetical protein